MSIRYADNRVSSTPQSPINEKGDLDVIGLGLIISEISSAGQLYKKQSAEAATVTTNEITSLHALIAYVAHHSGDSETLVTSRLTERFNVLQVAALPANLFDEALRYLVDCIDVNWSG